MSERWRVMRQDDNGNRYVMLETPRLEEAQAVADTYEARAHKQMYWVELVTEVRETR